jgi:hypothetical protein
LWIPCSSTLSCPPPTPLLGLWWSSLSSSSPSFFTITLLTLTRLLLPLLLLPSSLLECFPLPYNSRRSRTGLTLTWIFLIFFYNPIFFGLVFFCRRCLSRWPYVNPICRTSLLPSTKSLRNLRSTIPTVQAFPKKESCWFWNVGESNNETMQPRHKRKRQKII